MSPKAPVIKFSPFEALFIGEKNRILKRQPMKNTIFVTRLNERSKTINLRDLFGLEKTTETEENDVVFKIPQRVCDFLKHRRLHNGSNKPANEKGEILCYEFEGHKIITKSNGPFLPKGKIICKKPFKVKLKRKFKDNIRGKVVKKFPNPPDRRNYFKAKFKSLDLKNETKNSQVNRHLLRGKDGKFIKRSAYEKLKSEEISPKQKYLSNYLHQLYLKKNKKLFGNNWINGDTNSLEYEMPFSIETVVGLPNLQFDITASETILNEISQKYYKNNCCEDFQFPRFPNQLEALDFESDSYLIDIIYENFPKIVKFECQNQVSDFSNALLDSGILKPEKYTKIYEKKKNGFAKDEEIREIFDRRFPLIKLTRINDIRSNYYSVKNNINLCRTEIDEPYPKKSHLISGKSFGSFFFRSVEGKDIFIGNLMKPFLQNSWFGSLPES